VVVGTCGGSNFLGPQLDSIATQTLSPLEVVVSDDASEDGTVSILHAFAKRAPFDVRVVENRERLGFAENFLAAARLARGDLIAWSDQDDVWMPGKLERCTREFEDVQVRLVVHSRQIGERTTRLGRPLIRGGALARESRFGRRRRAYSPARLPGQFAAPGFASVLDRDVLRAADGLSVSLPGVFGDYGHDTWTAFVAAATGKVVYLPDVLAYYRQHDHNLYGASIRQPQSARAQISVGRSVYGFITELEMEAERGSFRAEILRQVDGDGATARARFWCDYAAARRRRLRFYRAGSARELIASFARGDYGRRSRGRFGITSLLRDVYQSIYA
jgi:glycosyltransferase involved in cell wall biosynthesis